jgi:hypothetical protein
MDSSIIMAQLATAPRALEKGEYLVCPYRSRTVLEKLWLLGEHHF